MVFWGLGELIVRSLLLKETFVHTLLPKMLGLGGWLVGWPAVWLGAWLTGSPAFYKGLPVVSPRGLFA